MKKIITILFILLSTIGNSQDNLFTTLAQGETEDREQNEQESQDNQGSMDAALDGLNDFFNIMNSVDDLYAASDALSNGECAPDFNTSNQAMMPSSCAGNAGCGECYTSAVGKLNFVRRQLARLSCIYNNTKNFNNAAIAFGDNASGIHAVTGLSWQYARGEIVATFNHFKQTYDKKYVDMIGALGDALQAINNCENQFGERDWYQRFGFIYFEFMKDKYKRAD